MPDLSSNIWIYSSINRAHLLRPYNDAWPPRGLLFRKAVHFDYSFPSEIEQNCAAHFTFVKAEKKEEFKREKKTPTNMSFNVWKFEKLASIETNVQF